MKLKIISVGRERSDPAAPLVADYLSRIRKFFPLEDTVLKAERDDKVTAKMIKEVPKGHLIVAMDEKGRQYDSYQFADQVSKWMNQGRNGITFIIGGAEGLSEEIKQKSDIKIALSKMTLPHRLARLILAEQVYRALCIINNIPYQK